MVMFLKKKVNSLKGKKKSKVVRHLPASHVRERAIVGKKKARESVRDYSFLVKLAIFSLILSFLAATIYIFLFSSLLTISAIDIVGADGLSADSLNRTIVSDMEGKIEGILKRNNFLVADTGSIERDLAQKYKRIKTVEIIKKFPDRLVVRLQERTPLLIYCSAGDCFVMDEDGTAFAKADFQGGELGEKDLIVLTDESGKKIVPDDFSMDLGFMRFVLDVKDLLDEDGIGIKKYFSTPILISGDLHVEVDAGWKIYFNQESGAKNGVEMLKTVLRESIDEGRINDLEYIDVRLADKVYYKFKNNEDGGTAADSNVEMMTEESAGNSAGAPAEKTIKPKKKK
jgi:hypothetical protein